MAGRKNLFASLTIVLHACVLRMLRPLRKLGCEFQYPLLNAKLDKLGIKIEFRVGRLPIQKVSLLFKMGLLGAGLYFPALSALNRWLGSPPGGRPSARAATQQRPCRIVATYAGMPDTVDRADLIAYLQRMSKSSAP
jgi:hypothetical protein